MIVAVADVQGLSYCSDAAIGRHLHLDPLTLAAAHQQLVRAELLAYQKPLYQLLGLDAPLPAPTHAGREQSVGEVLRRLCAPGRWQMITASIWP